MFRRKELGFLSVFICLTLSGYGAVFPDGNNITPYTRNDGGTGVNSIASTNSSAIAYDLSSGLNNSSTILNNPTGTFNFEATSFFDNGGGGLFTNSGIFNNSGMVTNIGNLNNAGAGTQLNITSGGLFTNNGILNNANSAAVNISLGGTFLNNGSLNNNAGGMLTNNGTLNNSSSLINSAGGTIQNNATFSNLGAMLVNAGVLNNKSSMSNTGTVTNQSGGALINGGALVNTTGALVNQSNATLTNNGFLQNDDILTNNGVLHNNSFGSLTNTSTLNNMGTINNNGSLTIALGSTFNQSGALNLNAGSLFLGQNQSLEINDNVTVGTVQVTLDVGAQLNVENRTGNITFQQPILNAGSVGDAGGFTQNSDVTTVLVGNNTFSGVTNVNAGILYVNGPSIGSPGTLITPVNVTNAAFGGTTYTRLKFEPGVTGSGTLNLNANSIVAPGGDALYGLLTIDGDVNFSHSTTIFDLEVDSVNNTDKIVAGGTANLNGALLVDAAVGNFIAGQRITVVEASAINGQFSSVTVPILSNGDPLFLVEYTSTTVDLVVQEDDLFSAATVPSGNPKIMQDYILSLTPIDPNSDLGFVVESLGLLSDSELTDALNLMHPAALGTFGFMNITSNSQIMQMMTKQIKSRPQKLSAPETISYLEPALTAAVGDRPFYPGAPVRRGCERDLNDHHDVWVQPFGSWNSQGRKGELRGANYETAGIMGGYDYLLSNFYVGGALGYAYTNFRWQGAAGKGHIDQVYGGLYGSYFMKFFSATLATMVGGNFYDVNRNIHYDAVGHPGANLDRMAHSHNTGIQWTNHLGLIGDFSPFNVFLQIFANLDHFYLHNGSFSESRAKSLNLRVSSKTSNALRSELGLSSSYTFQFRHGCWTPYAQISWVNKTLLSSSSYQAGFRGQVGTFSVNATSKGTNQVSPGMGIEFANKSGFSILLNARAELNGKMKNYFADMRLDYVF